MGADQRQRSEKKDKSQYDGKTYFRNLCGCFHKCGAKYLELSSQGTKEYRKNNGKDFKGCNRLEDKLLSEGLISHQHKKKDPKFSAQDLELIGALETLGQDDELVYFILRMNEKFGLMMNVDKFFEDFSLIRRSRPEDYKLIVLRGLIKKRHFKNMRHLCAIIIDLGLNDKNALFEYFPGLDYSEFCAHQVHIYKTIDEMTPLRIKLMKEAIATLKEKQWNALKAYYITHNQRLSMQKIADKMGISKESLRDRINGAKKKIRKYFEIHGKDQVTHTDLMLGFSELVLTKELSPAENSAYFN